jgi:hypothetical protein
MPKRVGRDNAAFDTITVTRCPRQPIGQAAWSINKIYGLNKSKSLMEDKDDPDRSREEAERRMLELLEQMDPDTRLAFEKMMHWLAERPKSAVRIPQERLEQMLEETRLENVRRRLGGKVGQVLAFQRAPSPAVPSQPVDKGDNDA